MKSHCHSCGREYLTARALAGQAIACRSCGALNDGAGGPPPAQKGPQRRANDDGRGPAAEARGEAGHRTIRTAPGAAFTIGGVPKPIDPAKLSTIEESATREDLKVAAAIGAPKGSRVIFALGAGAASVAVLLIVGILMYRWMVMPERAPDWRSAQRAVADLEGSQGDGSAFLVESGGELWLITSFGLLGQAPEINATFRDPVTGSELLRMAGLRTRDMRVATGVGEAEPDEAAPPCLDVVAANVEMYRPQIEACGIGPLDLASDSDIRVGTRVVALGYVPAQSDEGADMATHALFDGTISSVKPRASGVGYLQTSAQFEAGCIGGPILIESTQQVAGVQLDPASVSGRQIALSCSQVARVIDDGVQLSALRKDLEKLALERTGIEIGVKEAIEWPTFGGFDKQIVALETQGWAIRGQDVSVTGTDGVAELTHLVVSRPGGQIAFAVLSREPLVALETGDFAAAGAVISTTTLEDVDPAVRVAFAADKSSGALITVPPSGRITALVQSTFLGQPIRARIAYVFLERDPNAAASSSAPFPPPNWPPPPATPPAPAPASTPASAPSAPNPPGASPAPTGPPATPSSAPSSAPSPTVVPPPSAGGMASIVDFDPDYCNDEVFASSLLGLTSFDEKWLSIDPATGQQNMQPLVEALEAELDPDGDEDEQSKLMKSVRLASLGYSTTRFVSSRPVFNVLFTGMPSGAKVAVFAEVRPHGQLELLPVGKPFLASKTSAETPATLGDNLPLALPWNNDRLHQIRVPVDISVEFVARYEDGTEDRGVQQFRVLPPSDIERGYPCGLAWATLVDETHPYVRAIVNDINQDPILVRAGVSLAGAGGDRNEQLLSAFLFWREFVRRGLRYQNLSGTSVTNSQRARPVHESLCDRNANCVDGAVLFASFLKAVGFETYLVLLPGHALVAAQIDGGPSLFIETTALGTAVASDQKTPYDAEFRELAESYRFLRNDRTFHQFEVACAAGNAAFTLGLEQAELALDEWNASLAAGDPQLPDGSWRPEVVQALMKLSNQLLVVDIDQARRLGVRPIGVPPDLDKRHPLPR